MHLSSKGIWNAERGDKFRIYVHFDSNVNSIDDEHNIYYLHQKKTCSCMVVSELYMKISYLWKWMYWFSLAVSVLSSPFVAWNHVFSHWVNPKALYNVKYGWIGMYFVPNTLANTKKWAKHYLNCSVILTSFWQMTFVVMSRLRS